MNLLEKINQEHMQSLESPGNLSFRTGDTVQVLVKVREGDRERMQAYEGVVIGRKNRGLHSSFRVRKISYGEGVERVFPLYSPNIKISVIRSGKVRQAKIYYLRDRKGKSARIPERITKKVSK